VRRFRLRLPIMCSELKRSGDLAIIAISLRAAVRPLVRMPTD
jgi:hypothetical protein